MTTQTSDSYSIKNHNRMAGKRVLITGGTSGIGLAAAELMLQQGAQVAITGITPESLENACKTLPAARIYASESGSIQEQKRLAEKIKQDFGQLDALVLNAGMGIWHSLEDWTEADFDRQMSVNFKGPFFLLQALRPLLSNPASVVITTSIAAHRGLLGAPIYGASKAALLAVMRGLTTELAADGIRINAISPGPVNTPILYKQGMDGDKFHEQFTPLLPVQRFAEAIEIAQAILFLASDESSYLYGSDIVVDGGLMATFPG
ncbi:short chain dehydrogenase [Yersinia nurmii]|uniref:Short chain dehydrogenase n=2 Tax=Yersinia nurmii TaxID=685706 RepID=A0ABM9SIJ6_9GAMM|nr:short chain dehydrogenase [Yersinia nurmii]